MGRLKVALLSLPILALLLIGAGLSIAIKVDLKGKRASGTCEVHMVKEGDRFQKEVSIIREVKGKKTRIHTVVSHSFLRNKDTRYGSLTIEKEIENPSGRKEIIIDADRVNCGSNLIFVRTHGEAELNKEVYVDEGGMVKEVCITSEGNVNELREITRWRDAEASLSGLLITGDISKEDGLEAEGRGKAELSASSDNFIYREEEISISPLN